MVTHEATSLLITNCRPSDQHLINWGLPSTIVLSNACGIYEMRWPPIWSVRKEVRLGSSSSQHVTCHLSHCQWESQKTSNEMGKSFLRELIQISQGPSFPSLWANFPWRSPRPLLSQDSLLYLTILRLKTQTDEHFGVTCHTQNKWSPQLLPL